MTYYLDRAWDFILRNPGKYPPSYYINYGNVYILKFKTETRQTLSPQGKEWLEKALTNLQIAMEDKLTKTEEGQTIENDDEKFTDFAFDSHVKAYEDAGVLGLPVMDKVRIGLTPKAEDLFSDRGLAQVKKIGEDMILYFISHPIFAIAQLIEANNHKIEIFKLVHKYYLDNKAFFYEKMKQNPQHWSNPEYRILGVIRDLISPAFIF